MDFDLVMLYFHQNTLQHFAHCICLLLLFYQLLGFGNVYSFVSGVVRNVRGIYT